MRLLGRERLCCVKDNGRDAEKWLRSWTAEVMAAHWKHPVDVNHQFPNARHQGQGRFLFRVGSSKLTINLLIAFPQGVALITELKADDENHGS